VGGGWVSGYMMFGYVVAAANLVAIWLVSRIVMHGRNV